MPRILVVTHNYPRFPGDPAGAFVARIADALAARGDDVVVLAPHAPGRPEHETPRANLNVYRFRYAPDPLERVAYTGDLHRAALLSPAVALAFPAFLIGFARAVRAAVRDFKPDVIHAHWWVPGGWASVGRGCPVVITCHGSDVQLLSRPIVRRLGRRVLRRAAHITCVSAFLRDVVVGQVPAVADRVSVVRMPLDVEHFERARSTPKAVPPRIFYAGNLLPSKGVDVLLRAFRRLRAANLDVTLRIRGQGPAAADLWVLAATLGITDRVEFLPFVSQKEMPAEYAASTVTVLPTRGMAEGLGLALVEALLAGSAVIGSPAGGIPEVIEDERTGLLFRDGDDAHLAAQLERLLCDHTLRERLTAEGAARAREDYSLPRALTAFARVYDATRAQARA